MTWYNSGEVLHVEVRGAYLSIAYYNVLWYVMLHIYIYIYRERERCPPCWSTGCRRSSRSARSGSARRRARASGRARRPVIIIIISIICMIIIIINMYIHTHVYICIYVYIHTYVCMYVCMYIYIYIVITIIIKTTIIIYSNKCRQSAQTSLRCTSLAVPEPTASPSGMSPSN